MLFVRIALTVLALALLAYETLRARRGAPASTRLRNRVSLGLALLVVAAYADFGRVRGMALLNTWDTFHYFLGAKYFDELSYERIYSCTALAEVESGRSHPGWRIRDLASGRVVPVEAALSDREECRRHFSPERWAEFKQDAAYFWTRVPPLRWAGMISDQGFNATPVWILAGKPLANLAPASDTSLSILAALDVLLLVIAVVALGYTFGTRVTTLAVFCFAVHEPSTRTLIGGAFLRDDWFVSLVLALCLMRKQRAFSAGVFLAYASLLRIFPILLFAGPALQAGACFGQARFVARLCASLEVR